MAVPHIKRVYIEEGARNYVQTSKILNRLDGLPVEGVKSLETREGRESLNMDKETLRLLSFQGEFLKPCPGTQEYICCGYQILQVGTNCPLDCSYCILQAYFNQPSLRIFVNLESKLEPIGRLIESNPEKIFRIGTGEFTDSLALEPILQWTDILLPFFSTRKNAVLELKTKTDRIEGLFSSKWRDRIIVSWSLNSPDVASREEHGAPSIKKRLLAARKCQAEGFTLGFHFDPLIEHANWKEWYKRTLEMMDKYIDPKGIIWISLGCLRYMPVLKTIIRRRHPGTHILDGEFVPGLDGKMRYFKPIRIHMYAFIGEMLRKWHKDLGIYLCMESNEIWQKSLGWSPENSEGLSHYLDKRVVEIFG
ncbi:MAG: DNA photolyase [Deltaproteobacteria bacterium]|nr:MAG: DNA photolyase [Deltaproteobacteria bacterium]